MRITKTSYDKKKYPFTFQIVFDKKATNEMKQAITKPCPNFQFLEKSNINKVKFTSFQSVAIG